MRTTRQLQTIRNFYRFTGPDFCSFMRKNRVSIRDLAKHMKVTQKQVREVRNHGVDHLGAVDYHQGVLECAKSPRCKRHKKRVAMDWDVLTRDWRQLADQTLIPLPKYPKWVERSTQRYS